MKRVVAIFKKRWLLSLLGVLALAFLIWFVGPLLAVAGYQPLASELVRLVVIMVLVVAWGLNNLRIQMQEKRADAKIMEGIADTSQAGAGAAADAEQSAGEVAAIRERFEEALVVLKKSRDKSARTLYALPWYIIIGPPGSGKTTALLNSGLEFPLADRFGKEALRGIGGTRNCDWWFTNEAVLLDTAGRYVTQDSHQLVDSAGWEGFLSLLKRHRRRRPINGVLVAISLSDLMLQQEDERAGHIQAVRSRIQELHDYLGIRFPVYVLFTKADLVAGFVEFFDDLRREERAQVWGVTFPLDKDQSGVVQRFGDEFDALMRRLNDRLIWRLNQERDLQRRRLMFRFPQQMAALKGTLEDFLAGVFQPTRFQETPLLRGVYVTSGTQEGTPMDRMMAAVARAFGVGQQAFAAFTGPGRSYFITNLLKHVIFEEAALAGVEQRFERQRAWIQRGAYAGAIGATILAALAWSTSFTRNQQYISRVDSHVETYRELAEESLRPEADFEEILPRLDALRGIVEVAGPPEAAVPLSMKFGLYQGDKLSWGAEGAYLRELNNVFLPYIGTRLQQQLQQSAGDPDLQYEALKAYLMLGDAEHLDPDLLKLWMSLDWRASYPTQPAIRERLELHLSALLEGGMEPLPLNRQLVKDVRNWLTQVSLAELTYGRLRRDHLASDRAGFRLSDALGPDGQKVFIRPSGESLDAGIPWLFTYRGFYEGFLKESVALAARLQSEKWVLGLGETDLGRGELAQLETDLRAFYVRDYIRVWDDLLADLSIVPFENLGQGIEVLEILSSHPSPVRSVLQAVARNTNLNQLPGGGQGAVEEVAGKAGEKSRLARLMGKGAAAVGRPELPGEPVARHFARLNRLVSSPSGGPAPVDRLSGLVTDLLAHLNAVADGADTGIRAASDRSSGDIVQRIRVQAARQPDPVKTWLLQVANYSRGVTVNKARSQLDAKWRAQVLPTCERALAKRYPFSKVAQQETTLKDFGRFFGQGGLMDEFFKGNLKAFVDMSARRWRWQDKKLGMSDEVLSQFQRAALIRDTFFQEGGQKPSVRFGLKPLFLDTEISQFLLDLEGQKFRYRHGPTRVQNAKWPGPRPGQVRVVFKTRDGSQPSLSGDGPWAWFRILDRSGLEPVTSDRLVVTFAADGHQARYEIRASSVVNPFMMKELQQFRCPEGL